MKNREALLKQLKAVRAAEQGVKRAEKAVWLANQALSDAQNDVNHEFWANGGAIISVRLVSPHDNTTTKSVWCGRKRDGKLSSRSFKLGRMARVFYFSRMSFKHELQYSRICTIFK